MHLGSTLSFFLFTIAISKKSARDLSEAWTAGPCEVHTFATLFHGDPVANRSPEPACPRPPGHRPATTRRRRTPIAAPLRTWQPQCSQCRRQPPSTERAARQAAPSPESPSRAAAASPAVNPAGHWLRCSAPEGLETFLSILYNIAWYTFIILYYVSMYAMRNLIYYIIYYHTTLHYTILCYTILYYILLYYTVLCYAVLYCIILCCANRAAP